jgi:ribonuclease HI
VSDPLPLVAIYADESCLGNGREGSNPGGAAGVIEYQPANGGPLARFDYWVSEPATTNNRMAVRSAVEALRIISRKGRRCRVLFTSDSRYLVTGMSEWLAEWVRREWRRKRGRLENLELWQQAADLKAGHEIVWRWVRGHAGHPQNEYANYLAMRAAREQTSSDGPVPSGFDDWLARGRQTGRVSAEPAAFPDGRLFASSRTPPSDASESPDPAGLPNKGRRA